MTAYPDGEVLTLPLDRWRHPQPGDATVVERCIGPTLDVGCGPGRMAHAVAAAGIPALGIDISERAVAEARSRGASALRRDIFGHLPAAGRWHHILLLDGNIGIAANPLTLLARCRDSLRDGGTLLVEFEAPGVAVRRTSLRLIIDGLPTAAVPWMRVGIDTAGELAAAVGGVEICDAWTAADRWFAALRRRDTDLMQDRAGAA